MTQNHNIFFTSDLHLSHALMVQLRGFDTAEEMNAVLIDRWNARVGERDHVYVLGDIAFGKAADISDLLSQLSGKKYLVKGNHDYRAVVKEKSPCRAYFEWIKDFFELKVRVCFRGREVTQKISLMHYPMTVWPSSHLGAWHLFGHMHGKLNPQQVAWAGSEKSCLLSMMSMDVGVDTREDFAPYALDEVLAAMTEKAEKTDSLAFYFDDPKGWERWRERQK